MISKMNSKTKLIQNLSKIRDHFSQPGVKYGYDYHLQECRYRAIGKNETHHSCAIGCLIPDERYHPRIEEDFFIDVIKLYPDIFGPSGDVAISIYQKVQQIHDDHAQKNFPVSRFVDRINCIIEMVEERGMEATLQTVSSQVAASHVDS